MSAYRRLGVRESISLCFLKGARLVRDVSPTRRNVSTPELLAGYRDRMVAQGGCREPEAVGHCYRRHHLDQPGRVSGLSYYDQ